MRFGIRTPSLRKRIAAKTSIKRMIRSKIRAPRGYGWVTNPRKALYNRIYYRTTRKACYIATAVYGDIDAPQVVKLRKFRDESLRNTVVGKAFIFLYYLISPSLIWMFSKNDIISRTTKKALDFFLTKI